MRLCIKCMIFGVILLASIKGYGQCTISTTHTDVTVNGLSDGTAGVNVISTPTYSCKTPGTPTQTCSSCSTTVSTSTDVTVASGQKVCITSSNYTAAITLNGGTLVICGNATPSVVTINSGGGSIYITGTANFSNLNSANATTNLYNYGTLNIAAGFSWYATLLNHGTMNVTAGNVTVTTTGNVENYGTMNIQNGTLYNYHTFVNNSNLFIKTNLENTNPGTLTNNCTITAEGNYINNGTTHNFGSIQALSASINGGSVHNLNAGSELAVTNFTLNGTLAGQGASCSSVKVTGITNVSGGAALSGNVKICDQNGIETNNYGNGLTAFLSCTCSGTTSTCSYSWSNGATTAALSGLPAGTYTVTATCSGCSTLTAIVVITEPAANIPTVAVLRKRMDGGYYLTTNKKLYFKFEEEYAVNQGTNLTYHLYDAQRNEIVLPSVQVGYGDNRYSFDVSSLTSSQYYTLEVFNSKKEKWLIRFKVQ